MSPGVPSRGRLIDHVHGHILAAVGSLKAAPFANRPFRLHRSRVPASGPFCHPVSVIVLRPPRTRLQHGPETPHRYPLLARPGRSPFLSTVAPLLPEAGVHPRPMSNTLPAWLCLNSRSRRCIPPAETRLSLVEASCLLTLFRVGLPTAAPWPSSPALCRRAFAPRPASARSPLSWPHGLRSGRCHQGARQQAVMPLEASASCAAPDSARKTPAVSTFRSTPPFRKAQPGSPVAGERTPLSLPRGESSGTE